MFKLNVQQSTSGECQEINNQPNGEYKGVFKKTDGDQKDPTMPQNQKEAPGSKGQVSSFSLSTDLMVVPKRRDLELPAEFQLKLDGPLCWIQIKDTMEQFLDCNLPWPLQRRFPLSEKVSQRGKSIKTYTKEKKLHPHNVGRFTINS